MTLFVIIALYMQYAISQSIALLKHSEIERSTQYAKRISEYILNNTCDTLHTCLENDLELRTQLNHILQAFQTKNFRNLFVLYKNDKGEFRFLLDSAIKNPAQFNEPFTPEDKVFSRIYHLAKPEIIEQKGTVEEVWLSLLYPIVRNKHTEALLVLDLSKSYAEHIKHFNSPIQTTILLFQIFTLLSVLFLGYSFYHSYQLKKSFLIDPLTLSYTRTFRKEYLEEQSVTSFDFMLIDIDQFRRINDRHGRENADRILREFVAYMQSLFSNKTKIIRNHGTEFLIILPKGSKNFSILSQHVFEHLTTKRYLADNMLVSFTISMCGVVTPPKVNSYTEMQHLLDKKLLEIKSTGKNRLIVLDQISSVDMKYKNSDQIKSAIDQEHLTCVYQPIYISNTKEIIKYEALVRIVDDEESKLVSPYHFIEYIKETVHYIRLSKWVIQTVFKTLKENPEAEISINLDLVDLYHEEMMHLIKKELKHNQELAHRLTFEILEHNEITDFDRVDLIFKQLKSYGSKIAIDDFGSGYANFTYLANLDIDIIKIDASLIMALEDNNEMAKSIVALINKLGISNHIDVIAEHVSSQEIYDVLCDIGVKHSQGFFLGKPEAWEYYHPST
jgi:diguanylate cyclase (GGDEF)-like protein